MKLKNVMMCAMATAMVMTTGMVVYAEPTEIVNNDQVTFRIEDVTEDPIWGYTWNTFLENKTDKTLMYAVEDVSVNGVMMDPFWATEVNAGLKSNTDISWSNELMEQAGIEEVQYIDFTLRVYDSEDYMADPVLKESYKFNPQGVEEVPYEREAVDTDQVLVDENDVSITALKTYVDDIWGYTVELYLTNNTDQKLTFAIDNAAVNGFDLDPFWATTVMPGKASYAKVYWSKETFEENKIEDVTDINCTFAVSDADDWMADALVNKSVNINPAE